ncbi:MAG: hypothetical protein ABI629_18580 [bacterium]
MLAALLLPHAAASAPLDYLAIEANEGGSAGGHVAVRLGDEVFHLQHESDGLLRLHRDPTSVFRVHYALLQNRPVQVTRLDAPDGTVTALRDRLMRRLLVEAAERDRVAALEADVQLYAALADHPDGLADVVWPVRAAGYFVPDSFAAADDAAGTSAAIAAVRRAVVEAYGAAFLPRRLAAIRSQLAALPSSANAPGEPVRDDGFGGGRRTTDAAAYPVFAPTASTRLSELLEQRTALELLMAAPALRADALAADADAPLLSDAERGVLSALAQRRRNGLVDLVASSRPDWGYPLLLGLARLAAIEASLRDNRLRVLDAWPSAAVAPPLPDAGQRAAYFAALLEQTALYATRERRKCLAAAECREPDYARLEAATNRRIEMGRAARDDRAPRAAADPLVPARPALRRDLGLASPPADGPAAVAAAQAALAAYRAELAAREGYNVVTRNCATELLVMLDDAAQQHRVRPPWQAIPFVSAQAAADEFTVVGRETWPSFRAQDAPSTWRGQLAELTTVTAQRYRPTARDSTFLFFTDGAVAVRPLLGTANLAVGLTGGALGLATWPVDGGRRLRGGLLGALYSLPELAFVNLRKGTTSYLTTAEIEREEAMSDSPAISDKR